MTTAPWNQNWPNDIVNLQAVRDWLYVTDLLGWIEAGVLKVRASDVFKLIPDAIGRRKDFLIDLVAHEPPAHFQGSAIEVLR